MLQCFPFITLLGGKTSLTFFWQWNNCSVGLEISASRSYIRTTGIEVSKDLWKQNKRKGPCVTISMDCTESIVNPYACTQTTKQQTTNAISKTAYKFTLAYICE